MLRLQRILYIDCSVSGVSGNMMLGSLLDLGADCKRVADGIKASRRHFGGCSSIELIVKDVRRQGFRAKEARVKGVEEVKYRSGREVREGLASSLEGLGLSRAARDFALKVADTIISVEARLHGESPKRVHLHEAGSIDTVADILGTAIALEDLRLFDSTKVLSSPVAVGGGAFRFSHGAVSAPGPAALEILKGRNFTVRGGPVESELATPTGAAILTSLAESSVDYLPELRPLKVGYGAGSKDFEGVPNILRLVLGEERPSTFKEEICVLETNVDDVTGEMVGYAMERMMREGALDVSAIPIFTKKGRPGHIIRAISLKEGVDRLSSTLMEEVGTLGVRVLPCTRRVAGRRSVSVKVELGGVEADIGVKVSRVGREVRMKPEYEDVRALAERTGLPFREVLEMALKRARRAFGEGP